MMTDEQKEFLLASELEGSWIEEYNQNKMSSAEMAALCIELLDGIGSKEERKQVTEAEMSMVLKRVVDDGNRKIKEISTERDRLKEINRELVKFVKKIVEEGTRFQKWERFEEADNLITKAERKGDI